MQKPDAQNSVHDKDARPLDYFSEMLPAVFRRRFAQSLKRSNLNSWRQVAENSGCSPSLLQSIARGDYDNSSKGPGIFGTYRAAQALNVTLDDLVPPAKTPSIARFLGTYEGPETPIGNFGPILLFCDVYDEPKDGLTHIVRLGPRSLLSERSELSDPVLLQLEYERWPATRRKQIYLRQKRAWEQGALTSLEFFDVQFEHNHREVRVEFILSACRVTDFDGVQRLLIFCEPISHQN